MYEHFVDGQSHDRNIASEESPQTLEKRSIACGKLLEAYHQTLVQPSLNYSKIIRIELKEIIMT